MKEKMQNDIDMSLYDKLQSTCFEIYISKTGKKAWIDGKFLKEKEIKEVMDLLVFEVLLDGDNLTTETDMLINFNKFTDDYLEYVAIMEQLIFEKDLIWGKQLAAAFVPGEVILESNSIKGCEIKNPIDYKQKKEEQRFFIWRKVNDFYNHFIKDGIMTKESEVIFFHMFSFYILPLKFTGDNYFSDMKDKMGKYRKKGKDNIISLSVLLEITKIACEIGQVEQLSVSYKGIVDFLSNFNFKEDYIKKYWREWMLAEYMEDEGGLPIEIYSDFQVLFERWLEYMGVNVSDGFLKDGYASISCSNILEKLRDKLCIKDKTIINKKHFTYNISTEYLPDDLQDDMRDGEMILYNEDMLQYDRSHSYNRFWAGLYLLLSEANKSMISIIEFHCAIIYVMRRLDKDNKKRIKKYKNLTNDNEKRTEDEQEKIVEDIVLLLEEMEAVIKGVNKTISQASDITKEIKHKFITLLDENCIDDILRQILFEML